MVTPSRRRRVVEHLRAAYQVSERRACRATLGAANEAWAMDLMSDQLFDGRPFRILAVIDGHAREALATVPRASFRAYRVVEVLDRLAAGRDRPESLRVDTSAAELPEAGVRGQGARPVGLSERRGD